MTSRSADCVFGDARLISSARKKIRHGAARHVAELAGILVVHGKARDIRKEGRPG